MPGIKRCKKESAREKKNMKNICENDPLYDAISHEVKWQGSGIWITYYATLWNIFLIQDDFLIQNINFFLRRLKPVCTVKIFLLSSNLICKE